MAELRVFAPIVTSVLASSDACDRVPVLGGETVLRVNPREVLVIGDTDLDGLRRAVGESTGLVEDVSDGWAGFVLEGDDARAAFARLSELALPATGWVQGEVARAAANVVVEPGRLTLLVPAMVAAHIEERIRADAAEVLAP